jgi:hypothetical protein
MASAPLRKSSMSFSMYDSSGLSSGAFTVKPEIGIEAIGLTAASLICAVSSLPMAAVTLCNEPYRSKRAKGDTRDHDEASTSPTAWA